MNRVFNCYVTYMAESLRDTLGSWTETDEDKTIRAFFEEVVKKREGNRFDIHDSSGRKDYATWAPGDLIRFRKQRTNTVTVEAVLAKYVAGSHSDADSRSGGHFFLDDVQLQPSTPSASDRSND